jgi:hypothetical protein
VQDAAVYEESTVCLKLVGPITLGAAFEDCQTLAEVTVTPSSGFWLANDTTGQTADESLQGGRARFSLKASDFKGTVLVCMCHGVCCLTHEYSVCMLLAVL